MSQIIRVLQCFQCAMYQTDIAKKSNKWQCKLCGVKQSLRKELFRGSGAECRVRAQQMNMDKKERSLQATTAALEMLSDDDIDMHVVEQLEQQAAALITNSSRKPESKWLPFVDSGDAEEIYKNTEEKAKVPSISSFDAQKSLQPIAGASNTIPKKLKPTKTTPEENAPSSKWNKFV